MKLTVILSSHNTLHTIIDLFNDMVRSTDFVYLEIPPKAIYTAQGGYNIIYQNVLINTPFQFVKIGSKGSANGPKLTIDKDPQVDSCEACWISISAKGAALVTINRQLMNNLILKLLGLFSWNKNVNSSNIDIQ